MDECCFWVVEKCVSRRIVFRLLAVPAERVDEAEILICVCVWVSVWNAAAVPAFCGPDN
jgi:hypothetical protein